MSGAGKTQAVEVLEDNGYYCVDNVPPEFIGKFAALPIGKRRNIANIALVVDVRSYDMFEGLQLCLDELGESGMSYKILFLDCGDEVLVARYKETRRRHPLLDGFPSESTLSAISEERKILADMRSRADYLIDTSMLSRTQVRERIRDMFRGEQAMGMTVRLMSFGFKYGLPGDSDLVLDLRCLPNPFYDTALRPLCGLDAPIQDFLLEHEVVREFRDKLFDMLRFLAPLYVREGKSQLVISFGCTGGRHRSVAFAHWTGEIMREYSGDVRCIHRDIDK
jgi:UPF0042 nucleotide-binding protein